jgi:glycerol-3-phosphate dehydrogenase
LGTNLKRAEMLAAVDAGRCWDVLIIGGGATGLGTAVDAASRGYHTLLVEQGDFAQATSSRSTKLVHGGVRYLQQGNIKLVREALYERGLWFRHAPHLVRELAFLVPCYHWWQGVWYGIGLDLYDRLAGDLGLTASERLGRNETAARIRNLETTDLTGGVVYRDGQFDDARAAVTLARTAADQGAVLLTGARVSGLLRCQGRVTGVQLFDTETGNSYDVGARSVVNAGGIFSDAVRRLDEPQAQDRIVPSQGTHLVLEAGFLDSDTAILVPHTEDGRVLFAIPWQDRVLLGTTDVERPTAELEPRPLAEEIDFLLHTASRYLSRDPSPADVLSVFAGQRPLVRESSTASTAAMARDHVVTVSDAGLVTIAGGKWTTYRKMAADVVDVAARVAGLPCRPSMTEHLRLHGWVQDAAADSGAEYRRAYGADLPALTALEADQDLAAPLHPALPYSQGTVVWAARHEMALRVEDVLARRTRALLLDARAAVQAAPRTAQLLAAELGRDAAWASQQVVDFTELATGYLPPAG